MTHPTLTILIPAFNEERRLPRLFELLLTDACAAATSAGLELTEIVFVDDGSTDATSQLLSAAPDLGTRTRVITLPTNRGKGAAVKAGMLVAQGDRVLMTDVDLSTPLEDVGRLSLALAGADLAIGSRSVAGSEVLTRQPIHREKMGKLFNVLLRLLTGVPWRDTQCGFKLFDRARTQPLFELQRVERFAFDAELCVNARRLGLNVAEVPVRWSDHPDTRVGLMGAPLEMGLDLIRIAWIARRPLPVSALPAYTSADS